jgi:dCTP deaminase
MILTGEAIHEAVRAGDIVIDPFDQARLCPNSYDFALGDRCTQYVNQELDVRQPNPTLERRIPDYGIVLSPDRIYLWNTAETMGSTRYVPIIRGRSSAGRLGLFIDITADLIDIGSINSWTLQLHAVTPVRVYPGMVIGQVTFWTADGEIQLYRGKYGSRRSPVPSLSHLDPQC